MEFKDILNGYIDDIGCSGKELSEITGISKAEVSRFRNGSKVPDLKSRHISIIADGISQLAVKNGISGIAEEKVLNDFEAIIKEKTELRVNLFENLNMLVDLLKINLGDLAKFLGIDPSNLYRLKKGQRKLKNPYEFADNICRYIVSHYNNNRFIEGISGMSGIAIHDNESYTSAIRKILLSKPMSVVDKAQKFLSEFDYFDINDYINNFQLKYSDTAFSTDDIQTNGNYFGIENYKKAELDFIRLTLLSDSDEFVFMHANMPMADMAEDPEFAGKWIAGIAMMLKKGLNIRIIHDIDRPVNEMLYGLKGWIPLYMTGQITPYYLKKYSPVCCYLNYVSGGAALTGECLPEAHGKGKYYITDSEEEISYYRAKADWFLETARPLMKIFRKDSDSDYQAFRQKNLKCSKEIRSILCSLPMYTISNELLERVLSHNQLSAEERKEISEYVQKQREEAEAFFDSGTVIDEIPEISEEIFKENPVSLFLADIFFEKNVCYTYQEYREHFEMTKNFAEEHENYSIKKIPFSAFKNIQIHIYNNGKNVRISKCKSPAIHFIIQHPKLCQAIDNMVIVKPEQDK